MTNLIARLRRASELADKDRFAEALAELKEAYKLPDLGEDARGQIEARQQEIRDRRAARVRDLTGAMEALLAQPPEDASPEEEKEGHLLVARLQRIHPTPADLEPLLARWERWRKKASRARRLAKLRRNLEEIWQKEKILLTEYDRGLQLVRREASDYPDDPAFQELLKEAERKRAEAYAYEQEATTQALSGRFEPLLTDLKQAEEAGEENLPWYEWTTDEKKGRMLAGQRYAPAAEAIDHLRQLAREFEDNKAEEYRQRAEQALPAHPEEAADYIRKAQAFPHLSGGVQTTLKEFWEQHVGPALDNREQANKLAGQAQKDAPSDPFSAWESWENARKTDPHAPLVAEARQVILPHLQAAIGDKLEWAERVRREEGRFEDAAGRAEEMRNLAAADEALADLLQEARAIVERCEEDKDLLERLEKEAKEVTKLVAQNPKAAAEQLAALEQEADGRSSRFQKPLREARRVLNARLSLDRLLREWETRLRQTQPGGDETEAERADRALATLAELANDVETAIVEREEHAKIASFRKRLEARRAYWQGLQYWHSGLYRRAVEEWQTCQETGKEDAERASGWLKRAEDAAAVTEALEWAGRLQKEKQYGEALQKLKGWATRPSPRQEEVWRLQKQIRNEWEEALTTAIESLIANLPEQPLYASLEEKIRQLDELNPERASRYKYTHLPAIYEEWGDLAFQAREYPRADEWYQKGLALAAGETRRRLMQKAYRARRRQVEKEVEILLTNKKRAEARRRLHDWLQEVPQDARGWLWLAELWLEDESPDAPGEALGFLEMAGRKLETAHNRADPTEAGLETMEEVAAAQTKLAARRCQGEAMQAIRSAQPWITNRLQKERPLPEYQEARRRKESLIVTLKEKYAGEREKGAEIWRQTGKWFDEQTRTPDGAIERWYDARENELLAALRQEWKNTSSPFPSGTDRLEFRQTLRLEDLRQRWEIGLKLRFLYEPDPAAKKTLNEITTLQRELRKIVETFINDAEGPRYDLDDRPLSPQETLERQQRWGESLRRWLDLLHEHLGMYAITFRSDEKESAIRAEIREVRSRLRQFQEHLGDLERAIRDAESRLSEAKEAGHNRWGRVPWDKMAEIFLSAAGQTVDRTALQHPNPETRHPAWQEVANALQTMHLPPPEAGLWQEIERRIEQMGIEEKWAEITAPLTEEGLLVHFGRHRRVKMFLEEKEKAYEARRRLLFTAMKLYALVEAECFGKALDEITRMEDMDPEDTYRFRTGYWRIASSEWSWEDLRTLLRRGQEEWEKFQEWWRPLQEGALEVWQNRARAEAVRQMKKADFEAARQLCYDALCGAQGEGHTNRLGGGLALQPMLERLQAPPPLQETPFWRLRRMQAEVEQLEHDTLQAVSELRFWLEEEEGAHKPDDIDQPIQALQKEFKAAKEGLESALNELEKWPWWKRWDKKAQQNLCLEYLNRLRSIAPDWPDYQNYRQKIEEA